MKNLICLIFITIILLVKLQAQSYTYPTSKTVDSVDVYFGKTYADPYRWIENLTNTETINWFKAQNEYTEKVLATMPLLPKIFAEVKEADKVRKIKYAKIVRGIMVTISKKEQQPSKNRNYILCLQMQLPKN